MAKRFRWKKLRARGSCAKGSIRTKRLSSGRLLRICCLKGHWKRKSSRCAVGTVGYEIGKPKHR